MNAMRNDRVNEGLELVEAEGEDPIFANLANIPLEQLRTALQTRPGLVRVTDANGWLLLHHAVDKGLPLEKVQCLAHAWPESVRQRGTNGGQLPIHLVSRRTSDPSVVAFLAGKYPEALYLSYEHEAESPRRERAFTFSLRYQERSADELGRTTFPFAL